MILDRWSEWEFFRLFQVCLYIHRLLCCCMALVTIDKDCFIRRCRAGKFTMSASNTNIISCFGNDKLYLVWYHMHCFCGTAFSTGTTCSLLSLYYAVILNKNCFTNLRQFFRIYNKRQHCSGWANLNAPYTFIGAKPFVIVHMRLHNR